MHITVLKNQFSADIQQLLTKVIKKDKHLNYWVFYVEKKGKTEFYWVGSRTDLFSRFGSGYGFSWWSGPVVTWGSNPGQTIWIRNPLVETAAQINRFHCTDSLICTTSGGVRTTSAKMSHSYSTLNRSHSLYISHRVALAFIRPYISQKV